MSATADKVGAHEYPIKPVPFTAVKVDDVFWAPKIETNRAVTIPFASDKCETTGWVSNFIRTAEILCGGLTIRM